MDTKYVITVIIIVTLIIIPKQCYLSWFTSNLKERYPLFHLSHDPIRFSRGRFSFFWKGGRGWEGCQFRRNADTSKMLASEKISWQSQAKLQFITAPGFVAMETHELDTPKFAAEYNAQLQIHVEIAGQKLLGMLTFPLILRK